jgi:hypothetical protein
MATSNTYLLHPKHRPDIDGLRDVSVLSVVLRWFALIADEYQNWRDVGLPSNYKKTQILEGVT